VVFGHAHAAFGVRRNPAASETLFRVLAAYSSKLSSSHMITCPLITLTLYKESEEKRLLNAMLQMMLRAEQDFGPDSSIWRMRCRQSSINHPSGRFSGLGPFSFLCS
jgi:hypothetical protein